MSTLDLELPSTILIADPDPAVRTLLKRGFSHSATALEAANEDEALRQVHQDKPGFMLVDLNLPSKGGLEFIRKARATHYGACVPILVFTVASNQQAVLECFRQGADDFMVKPFALSELRVRVSSIFLRQRVARDANPLTLLPGNWVIRQQIAQRREAGLRFSVAVLDLDHFKAFNDSRGYDAGDAVIQSVGELATDFAEIHREVFVGHVGGDDFMLLLPEALISPFAEHMKAGMAEIIQRYYRPEELARGWVKVHNREGQLIQVPLLSLSIGVVDSTRPGFEDYRHLTEVLAEVKAVAKRTPGNSLFIDRRRVSSDLQA